MIKEATTYQRTEKLTCPNCGAMDSKVIDSKPDQIHGRYRRRRQCSNCQSRYMLVEIVVTQVAAKTAFEQK